MCECGCYEAGMLYRVSVEGSQRLVVRTVPGCRDCDAPPGLRLEFWNDDLADMYDYDYLPELEIHPTWGCDFECGINRSRASEYGRKSPAAMEEGEFEYALEEFWDATLGLPPRLLTSDRDSK